MSTIPIPTNCVISVNESESSELATNARHFTEITSTNRNGNNFTLSIDVAFG